MSSREPATREQLSPKGLALIAGYYNSLGDQTCRIYVASTSFDFANIVLRLNSSPDETKAVVIFQPTDHRGQAEIDFPSFHKNVIYLEKKRYYLHIVLADSTPHQSFESVCFKLIDAALGDAPYSFYSMEHLLHPVDNSPLFLQNCYFNCGVVALLFAREIALSEDFLAGLKLKSYTLNGNGKINFKYQLPVEFAKCADNELFQRQALKLYEGDEAQALDAHFKKYPGKFNYTQQVLSAHIEKIYMLLIDLSQDEMVEMIRQTDAKNYSSPRSVNKLLKLDVWPEI